MYYPFLAKLYFLCAIAAILLFITLLFKAERSSLKREFIAFLLLISMVYLVKSIELFSVSPSVWLVSERIMISGNIFCCSIIFFMVNSYLNRKTRILPATVILSIAAALSVLSFTSFGVTEVIKNYPLKRTTGFSLIVTNIFVITLVSYSFLMLIINYFSLKGLKKLQAQYFIIGFASLIFFGTITFLVLPSSFPPESIAFIMASLPLIPLAIITYSLTGNLLNTEIALFNVFKYSLLGILLISSNHLFFHVLHMKYTVSLILAMAIAGIVFFTFYSGTPLSNEIENMVFRKRFRYHQLLNETSKAVITILDVNKLLDFVVNSLHKALGAQKIGIFFAEKLQDKTILRLKASTGLDKAKTNYILNQNIIRLLETNKHPFILDNAFHNLPRQESKDIVNELSNFGAALVLPLICKNELIGVMTIDQKSTGGGIFDIHDIELLETLANNLGIAIKNAMLYENLDDTYIRITRALSLVLETKDNYTVGHSDNVTKYAIVISKKLNLPEMEVVKITQAAMLHDLGKIGIHDYILEKPTKLTPEEWEEVKPHTVKGAKILESLPFLKEVAEIVKHHHEHYNGTGYPEQKKYKDIPLGAQILGVADAFDAMTTERPYKNRKLDIDTAINELIKFSGTQFNPEIVKLFIEAIKENPNIILMKKMLENDENTMIKK